MLPIFQERQRMPQIVIFALLAGVVVFGIVVVVLQAVGNMPPETMRTLWIAWAVLALTDGAIASISMVTEVRADGVVLYCRPLVFLRREILWDAVERVYARQYSPLREYGGWGIRLGKGGTAYNMRGNQGIQLEMKDGKRILIGTQRPEGFLTAVRNAGGAHLLDS